MAKRKYFVEQALIDRPPFAGPQHAYVTWLSSVNADQGEEIKRLNLVIQLLASTVQKLNLWHNHESKTYLTTPQGKIKHGGEFVSGDLDLERLVKEDKDILLEILQAIGK